MQKTKPQDRKYHYVYKILLAGSKRYYIGRHSTDNEDFLNDGYFGSGKWTRSIKDKSRLSKLIIAVYDTYEELLFAEEALILEHIYDKPNCMNMLMSSCGAAPGERHHFYGVRGNNSHMYGKSPTEETRKKISNFRKSKYAGENHPNYGKTLSKETKQKLSVANKGKTLSKEHRQKMSDAHKGENSHMYGKTLSEETRQKISVAKRGENSSSAKLKKTQVIEIREKYAVGGISQKELSKEYCVSETTVHGIVNKIYWKHI